MYLCHLTSLHRDASFHFHKSYLSCVKHGVSIRLAGYGALVYVSAAAHRSVHFWDAERRRSSVGQRRFGDTSVRQTVQE